MTDWPFTVKWRSLRHHGVRLTTGPFGTVLSASEYVTGGIPLVNPTHIRNGTFCPDPHISVSPLTAARLARHRLEAGDLVVGRHGDVGRSALVSEQEAGWICGSGSIAVRPGASLQPRYLQWVFTSDVTRKQLLAASTGATMDTINEPTLRGLEVYSPPISVQRAIADFLDTETARINALIDKKRRLTDRLAEHFAAFLEQTIWSGLDERMPLMFRTQLARPIMYGIVLPGPHVAEGVPIVKGGDVSAGRLSPDQLSRTTFDIEAPYARARLREGDLVFAIRGGVGDVRVVPAELSGANITQDVARVAPAPDVDPTWLLLVLQTRSVQAEAAERTTGATIRGLNIWELKRLGVPSSSAARQRDDLAVLLPARAKHDRSRSALKRQIELLREHRQALITAAVTGELEIPGVA